MTSRWLRFSAVGVIGVVAQLAALGFLHGFLSLNYPAATAFAVEAAVLHNFIWHKRWTWRDRPRQNGGAAIRLLRFNLSTGLVSILTNLASMHLLVGTHHAPYLAASLMSISAGVVANFLVSDLFVFRDPHSHPMM